MQIISSETTETHTIVKYISDENNIITVLRPILTEEERAKRMEEIKRAAVKLVLSTERAKLLKEQKEREAACRMSESHSPSSASCSCSEQQGPAMRA